MQPNKLSPLSLFSSPVQYLIPIFQRGYVWKIESQIMPLWSDILERATDLAKYKTSRDALEKIGNDPNTVQPPRKHFLGTIVITDHRSGGAGNVTTAEVIDGQQRMTTMQLFLIAFRDALKNVSDQYLREIVAPYTWNGNNYKQPHYHYKIWPTNAGRAELAQLIDARSMESVCKFFPIITEGKGRSKIKNPRPQMVEAYLYFYGVISMFLRGIDFEQLDDDDIDPSDALLNELMDVERSLSNQWIHSLRHNNIPVPPSFDLPILDHRIELLHETLTEYFQLIELRLDADDDAQIIFETLNARGEKLFPSDLIRNYVFLQATRNNENVGSMYEDHWKDFDERNAESSAGKGKKFWKLDERQGRLKNTRLDLLLYHYVSMRTQDDIKVSHVFESFKQWWNSKSNRITSKELFDLQAAAMTYSQMLMPDKTTRFGLFSHRIKILDSSTLIPVVLYLREHMLEDSEEFCMALTLIESYLVRRAICGHTPKAYNRIFPTLLKTLVSQTTPTANAIKDHLLGLKGITQHWPDDEEFNKMWNSRPAYNTLRAGKTRMVLEALELEMHNSYHEFVGIATNLSIEHVLPQGWETAGWKLKESTEANKIARDQILHTFGNLTLLTQPLNSALSNSLFQIKRPEITKSLLAMNAFFQDEKWKSDGADWNESAIIDRGNVLFSIAKKIWPRK